MHLSTFRFRRNAAAGLAFGAFCLLSGSGAWAQSHTGHPQKSAAAQAKDKKKPKAAKTPKHPATAPPATSPAAAVQKPTGSGAPIALELPIQKTTLDNGLRVIMSVDKTSPTVAVAVTYDVGSRNEQKGRSGFAHLFEHMMFQGSANVPKGEHFRLVSGHGGVLNGTTSTDRTNYFEVLPSNELALALWLEADRMKSLDVSATNFENQRSVVEEEYRMRVSNAAYQPSAIRLEELVYQGYWPYEHDTIGSMRDLDGAKLDWVAEFFAHHYGPNNAVLTIVGDFEPDQAMALVHRYFDAAKKISVDPYEDAQLPEQTSQRTAVVKDDNARTPGILYGWAAPPMRHPDHYALEIAAGLLADGESSRLHQLLVREKSVAQEVSTELEGRRGHDLFTIDATLVDKAKVGDVEKMIDDQLKELQTRPPSAAELEKARRRAMSAFVFGLQSNMARANRLGEYEVFFGDAKALNGELARYGEVTAEDVRRVATTYLGPTRRTIVETYPSGPPPPQAVASVPAPKSAANTPAPKSDSDTKKGGSKKADSKASKKTASKSHDAKKKKAQ